MPQGIVLGPILLFIETSQPNPLPSLHPLKMTHSCFSLIPILQIPRNSSRHTSKNCRMDQSLEVNFENKYSRITVTLGSKTLHTIFLIPFSKTDCVRCLSFYLDLGLTWNRHIHIKRQEWHRRFGLLYKLTENRFGHVNWNWAGHHR